MAVKRVIAYAMHETERDAAAEIVDNVTAWSLPKRLEIRSEPITYVSDGRKQPAEPGGA
jgi:hypothetical protein